MKHSLRQLSPAILFVLAPVVLPSIAHAQGSAVDGKFAGIPVSRLWLADSREYLRPQLEMAVLRAQQNTECAEVMYASLNEYRTANEEPSFTILCRRDYRTTFNLVFRISELDPSFLPLPAASDEDEEDGESALQLLRERLGQEQLLPAEPEPEPPRTPVRPAPAPAPINPADDLSLDLDLDEMLRESPQNQEPAPDIF